MKYKKIDKINTINENESKSNLENKININGDKNILENIQMMIKFEFKNFKKFNYSKSNLKNLL